MSRPKKEQHVIISKHRREDIFVDNYFVCADARVKRVRVEMYTANLGVCMSVSTPSPMILKLCMHNPNLKSKISNKCFIGKSIFPNFSTFFAIEARYCRRRRKCILMQKWLKNVTWRGTEVAALMAHHYFWTPLQFGVGQQLIFVDDFWLHCSNLQLLWYSKTNFPFGGASLPFWTQAYLQW